MNHKARRGALVLAACMAGAGAALFLLAGEGPLTGREPRAAPERSDSVVAAVPHAPSEVASALGGQLVDAQSGEPLPGRGIVFDPAGAVGRVSVRSDAGGYFFLAGVLPGRYRASLVDPEFFLSPDTPEVVVAAGDSAEEVVLRASKARREIAVPASQSGEAGKSLGKGGTIRGILVDTAGHPKQDVEISARVMGAAHSAADTDASAEDGSFHLEELGPGEYRLSVSRFHFSSIQDEVQRVALAADENIVGLRIVVPEMGQLSIAGQVEDTRGRPIFKAHVSLWGSGGYIGDETDAGGRFRFERLQESTTLGISAAHNSFSESAQVPVEAGASGVKIVLKDRAVIEGRVVSAATGSPVAAFQIAVRDENDDKSFFTSQFRGTEVREANGRFVLRDVDDGAIALVVQAKGYAETRLELARVAGGETRREVVVRMASGATLRGRVVDAAGQPVVGAKIFVAGRGVLFGSPSPDATSGADGTFRLDSLESGAFNFRVNHEDYAPKSVETRVAPYVDTRVEVVMTAGGTIEGVVTLDGMPVPRQGVHANGASAETDGSGRYRLSGLADGSAFVSLSLVSDGVQREQGGRAIVKDGKVAQLDFPFISGSASIEGTLYEDEGVPLREPISIEVWIRSGDGNAQSFETQSDASGHYKTAGLPAGTAHVCVEVEETMYAIPVQVAAGQRVIQDLFLFGGATLRIALTGRAASQLIVPIILMSGVVEIDQASMDLFMPGIWPVVRMLPATGSTAELKGVPPGTYTIVVMTFDRTGATIGDDPFAGAGLVTKVIEVRTGEDLSIELEL